MTHPHTKTSLAVALLTLSLASACGTAMSESEASMAASVDAPRQALEVADSVLAANVAEEGPADGFWPFLADDAIFLEPDLDIVQGRDAVRAALQSAQPSTPTTMKLHRISSGLSDDHGLGYTFGWTELVKGDGTTAYEKYIGMWRLYTGHWRLEGFVRAGGRGAPAIVMDGVLLGWHGVALPGDPADLAAGIDAADVAFSDYSSLEGKTYCDAFPAFADEHAIVFGGSNFYYGLDWVRRAYSGCTAAIHASWAPVASRTTGSGDLGFSVGNATFWTDLSTGGTSYLYEKYLTVWVRQQDGGWKWILDAGSFRPAP